MQHFEGVLSRLEARIEGSDRLLDKLSKFSGKALDEVYRMSGALFYRTRSAESVSHEEDHEFMIEKLRYNGRIL